MLSTALQHPNPKPQKLFLHPNEISLHLVHKKMADEDELTKSLPLSEDDNILSNEGGWQKVKDLVAERFE